MNIDQQLLDQAPPTLNLSDDYICNLGTVRVSTKYLNEEKDTHMLRIICLFRDNCTVIKISTINQNKYDSKQVYSYTNSSVTDGKGKTHARTHTHRYILHKQTDLFYNLRLPIYIYFGLAISIYLLKYESKTVSEYK
jgi:hypothetical protein